MATVSATTSPVEQLHRSGSGATGTANNKKASWRPAGEEDASFIKRFFFLALRAKDDTLVDTTRKIIIAWSLPLATMPFLAIFYLIGEALNETGFTLGTNLTIGGMALFLVTWVPTNLYVRFTGRLPTYLMDAWILLTYVGCWIIAVSIEEYPISQIAFFLASLAFLANTPRMYIEVALCGILYLFDAVNNAFAGKGRGGRIEPMIVSDPYFSTISERLVFQGTVCLIGLIVAAALLMQATERSSVSQSAAAASKMATLVAHELCRFDTGQALLQLEMHRSQRLNLVTGEYMPRDAAMRAYYIEQQQAAEDKKNRKKKQGLQPTTAGMTAHDTNSFDGGSSASTQEPGEKGETSSPTAKVLLDEGEEHVDIDVDPILIESFELLIDHFERFRPHLPHWLLSSAAKEGHQMVREHKEILTDFDVNLDELLDASQHKITVSGSGTVNNSGDAGGGDFRLSPRNSVMGDTLSTLRPGSVLSSASSSRHAPLPNQRQYFEIRNSRVAIAMIDFRRSPHIEPNDRDFGTDEDPLCAFVDCVHEAAELTYAAVHSFVGDTVLASWNTGRFGAQVETKAARFLAVLRSMTDQLWLRHQFACSGAVISGDATVQMAGMTGRQHGLTVSFPRWQRGLAQLAAFASTVGAFLVDHETSQASRYTVESRFFDYVHVSRNPVDSTSLATPNGASLTELAAVPTPKKEAEVDGEKWTFPVYEVVSERNGRSGPNSGNVSTHTVPAATSGEAGPLFGGASLDVAATGGGGRSRKQSEEWMYALADGSDSALTTGLKTVMVAIRESRFADGREVLLRLLEGPATTPSPPLPPADAIPRSGSPGDGLHSTGSSSGSRARGAWTTDATTSAAAALMLNKDALANPSAAPTSFATKDAHVTPRTLATAPRGSRRLLGKLERLMADDRCATFSNFPEDLRGCVSRCHIVE